MKIKISEVKFVEDLYPRKGIDPEMVNQYSLNLDALPPIVVTEDLTLVDGYHRLVAYRNDGREEIETKIIKCPQERILYEATRRNALHGKQLTIGEKRHLAAIFFKEGLREVQIAKVLALGKSTVSEWLKNKKHEAEKERNERILDLYLACKTQREIAHKIGLNQGQIARIMQKFVDELSKKLPTPESLEIYNIWNFSKCDRRYGLDYPGRIPGQIVENVLYYYTQTFDLVVDPMAGGGTTIDVCKAMIRRYLAYDINPVREDIKRWDIAKGFPKETKNCDLIFLDPPYWRLQRGGYSEKSVSNATYGEWLAFMGKLAKDSYKTVKKEGHVVLLLTPFLDEKVTNSFLDLPFKCFPFFKGFTEVQRVSVPMPSQIKSVQDIEYAKEKRILLDLNRDLIIFRKEKHA